MQKKLIKAFNTSSNQTEVKNLILLNLLALARNLDSTPRGYSTAGEEWMAMIILPEDSLFCQHGGTEATSSQQFHSSRSE